MSHLPLPPAPHINIVLEGVLKVIGYTHAQMLEVQEKAYQLGLAAGAVTPAEEPVPAVNTQCRQTMISLGFNTIPRSCPTCKHGPCSNLTKAH